MSSPYPRRNIPPQIAHYGGVTLTNEAFPRLSVMRIPRHYSDNTGLTAVLTSVA
nr:hypothetical protein [Mycobacterium uberis]